MDALSGLDWDSGNLTKCQQHGVPIEEIENVFAGTPRFSPDAVHSVAEQRFIAVGRNGEGRAISSSSLFGKWLANVSFGQ